MAEVVVRSQGGLAQAIQARSHHLLADEPREAGGGDDGPTPYELLLAALGTCTAITLKLYAQRKGWPLESVEVRLRHDRIHARDCADCETKETYLDRIQKELLLQGDLSEEQRARLAEIARRCPVNQTLSREIRIEDRLVGADG